MAKKIATGQGGSTNISNHFAGDWNSLSVSNSRPKPLKNQRFCQCGAIIPRDEQLFEKAKTCKACQLKEKALTPVIRAVMTTPRRVFICKPCRNCGNPFTQEKLVSDLTICESCLRSAQTESPAKRSKIISQIVRNYTLALQRQIFAGGAAR